MATNGIQEQMNDLVRRLEQQNEMIAAMQENLRNEQRRAEAAEERTREVMRAGQQQMETMQNLMNTAQETYQRNLEEVREKTSREQSLVDTKIIKGQHEFKSDRSKWHEWSYKIQGYFAAANEAADAAMDWAADNGNVVITKDSIESQDPIWWRISKQIHDTINIFLTESCCKFHKCLNIFIKSSLVIHCI